MFKQYGNCFEKICENCVCINLLEKFLRTIKKKIWVNKLGEQNWSEKMGGQIWLKNWLDILCENKCCEKL